MVLLALLLVVGAVLAVAVAAAPALADVSGDPPDYVLEEGGLVVIDGDLATDCPSFAGGVESGFLFGGVDPEQAQSVLELCRQAGLLPSGGSAPVSPTPQPPNDAETSSDLAASSGDAPPYPGFPDPEDPPVVENGGIRVGYDIFTDCRSDYRVLGEENARACDEAGLTPLNYPGDDGPFLETPGAVPETGGPAPALLGAGALASTAGLLLVRRYTPSLPGGLRRSRPVGRDGRNWGAGGR